MITDLHKGVEPEQRRGKRWQARLRDQAGREHKRRFATRADAVAYEAQLRMDPRTRQQQAAKHLTVDAIMAEWLASKRGLAPKTLDAYRTDAREVLLTFSGELVSSLTPKRVQAWASRDRGPSLARRSLLALSQACNLAVSGGLLAASPCVGVRKPRPAMATRRALTAAELRALAEAIGPEYAPMVWLMGTVGLRLGEAVGLQVGDVSPDTGRLRVVRQVTWTRAGATVGPPKGGKSREVSVPARVLALLPVEGRARDEWLFRGTRAPRVNAPTWRRHQFAPAARAAGLGRLDPHELRHTAASLAIASGADVLAVQRMLGHASPEITLRIYSHWFDRSGEDVARRMDDALGEDGQ